MAVATGFFDGVHLGHRHVISSLVTTSKARGEESVVVTFWPHPRVVLQRESSDLKLLTSLDEKKEILTSLGVDRIYMVPFTRDFSLLSAKDYLRDYVRDKFGGKTILLGYDNRFGCGNASPEEISVIAQGLGLEVIRPGLVSSPSGVTISSTKIRTLLTKGDVAEARTMLGYDYTLTGLVVRGDQFGRTIGFPTANMRLSEPLKLLPGSGAYLVKVRTSLGDHFGMCNVGVRPTVSGENKMSIETHIFDFDSDIYGLPLKVSFLQRLRPERKFASVPELQAQLERDRAQCRQRMLIFSTYR